VSSGVTQSSVAPPRAKQENCEKLHIDSRSEAEGFIANNVCPPPATMGFSNGFLDSRAQVPSSSGTETKSSRFQVGRLETEGFPCGNSQAESKSASNNCMNMSVDEPKSEILRVAAIKASKGELMDGSFRNESKGCHGDTVSMATNRNPASGCLAAESRLKSVVVSEKPATKNPSSSDVVNPTIQALSSGLAKSSSRTDFAPNPLSFGDIAQSAAVPQSRCTTSQVNDSFNYRDKSVVLISDDDDDNDEKGDKVEVTELQSASDRQNGASKEDEKTFPNLKTQMNLKSEVSASGASRPSTVITICPPANSSIKPASASADAADVQKLTVNRDTVAKLLSQKKVCRFLNFARF